MSKDRSGQRKKGYLEEQIGALEKFLDDGVGNAWPRVKHIRDGLDCYLKVRSLQEKLYDLKYQQLVLHLVHEFETLEEEIDEVVGHIKASVLKNLKRNQ